MLYCGFIISYNEHTRSVYIIVSFTLAVANSMWLLQGRTVVCEALTDEYWKDVCLLPTVEFWELEFYLKDFSTGCLLILKAQ